ncbi:LysR family transcriptional regulator [Emcibacter sp.]|uniref:LysR family transcriptional regulator n=1 Tax=Emcibacter sp. TaxID=1979954 RepID=UPI002AA6D100|nr:LysR family transcriptional regulator [Emcibacter sp.]
MRLDNFDLNLLVAFNVLLEERNVTRAADRLNVTQSAMSAALRRLREALQDEILIQHGKKMIPTPHALDMAPEVASAIIHLRSVISTGTGFDPRTSQRRFKIAASDYITTVLIVPLMKILGEEAPGIKIDLSLPSTETTERLVDGELDLFLTPEEFLKEDLPRELLFEERHVVVGWSENPVMQKPLTEESFFESGHVAVMISGGETYIERALRSQGFQRVVEVTAPSFIQVPWLLSGTRRLALMHERLARLMAPGLSLTISEVPLDLPVMREMMQWHATRSTDAGLLWLRKKILQMAVDRLP